MGFSSVDDLVNEISANGKTSKLMYQKTSVNGAASAAGRWHECFTWAGFPVAGVLTGTAGTAFSMDSTRSGSLGIGANVSPDTRHILNASVFSPTATMLPATFILCDFLVTYPSLVVTGTASTLTPTALPRYTNGDGVMGIVSVQSALGAASPALTFTYTDQAGNAGNVAAAITAPAVSAPLSTLFQVDGSPFIRLAAGDTGIRSVQSYTIATGTTGAVSLSLVKPLATIPVLAINTASERDFLYQLPSLPQIQDGACLGWIVQVGGALVTGGTFQGLSDLGWG
jgi:hypothetical protein